MKKLVAGIVVVLVVCVLSSGASADWLSWNWGGGDNDWDNADNWGGAQPAPGDALSLADHTYANRAIVGPTVNDTLTGSTVYHGCFNDSGDHSPIDFTGGTVWVLNWLMGGSVANTGVLNMDSGNLNVEGEMRVGGGWDDGTFSGGFGTINMTGGNIEAFDFYLSWEGHGSKGGFIQLDGGQIGVSGSLAFGAGYGNLMDITGGVLRYYNIDAVADLQLLADAGTITAYGGIGTVAVEMDGADTIAYGVDPGWTCDPPLAGDANGDCKINLEDLALLCADWLKCNRVPASYCD